MSVLSLQLPNSIHVQVQNLAEQEGISINEFITLAIAEKLATIDTKNYLQKRAQHGSREKLLAVLAKAPDIEPDPADKLPK